MYRRNIEPLVLEALADTRAVYLAGARQCGKSTLARAIAERTGRRYLTLDDPLTLDLARADPAGLAASAARQPLVIDEAQRLPELLLAVKRAVDDDPAPGRFLLTGSANFLALPQVADSLAGRVEIIELHTLSQGELRGRREGFLDALLEGSPAAGLGPSELGRADYLRLAEAGGYPEAVGRQLPARRRRWFASYLDTIIRRDLRDIAAIEHVAAVPALLRLIAGRVGSTANVAGLAQDLQLPHSTVTRYLRHLETLYLLAPLPAWSTNFAARLTKSPKLYLADPGLSAALAGTGAAMAERVPEAAGQLLEAFAVAEVRKQATWSETAPTVSYLRTYAGLEVDLVLEAPDGRVAALEVKAAARPERRDFRGLAALRDELGSRFIAGAVLSPHPEPLPAGDRLWALPLDALWRA
ncbi:ATP-binding protein [Tepidiforma flava]|uniref:ATP-binding protein n=1 Tax=Tepidiforma flava TaxID=3004094 RepID=A0ABY7M9L9_9CHLR|nr:ATP-binding protein [Tepidiforma flava]WBL37252.1 ATP-binding protein [Tepidiforma flava]